MIMRKTSNPILAPTVIGFGSPVPFPSMLSLNGFYFIFLFFLFYKNQMPKICKRQILYKFQKIFKLFY